MTPAASTPATTPTRGNEMTPKAHFIFLSDFWIINTFARSRGVLMADVSLFYCQLPAERPHAAGRAPVPHPAPAWNAVRHCDARRRGRRLQVRGGRGARFVPPATSIHVHTAGCLHVYMFTGARWIPVQTSTSTLAREEDSHSNTKPTRGRRTP